MTLHQYASPDRIKRFTFPDGQPHITLLPGDPVSELIWKIRTPQELYELRLLAGTLPGSGGPGLLPVDLRIPYLMTGRSDRSMFEGDPCGLSAVADVINACRFRSVGILDPHSERSLQLVERAYSITPTVLLEGLRGLKGPVLVRPDQGSRDPRHSWRADMLRTDLFVDCDKDRTQKTIQVRNPELVTGNNCVIVDDLCDGGWTFVTIAAQLRKHNPRSVGLAVTHGVFSNGLSVLEKHFDWIRSTDSFRAFDPTVKTTCIPIL